MFYLVIFILLSRLPRFENMIATTQLKHFSKSGARLYIKQQLLELPEFPFEEDEILKVEIMDGTIVLSRPEWWEMLDWNEMKRVWKTLPEETKDIIRKAGLGPDEG